MINKNAEILTAREQRANKIAFFLNENKAVVSIHANIPGDEKQTKQAYFLVRYYAFLFLPEKARQTFFYDSSDGPYLIMTFNDQEPSFLKETAVFLEEKEALGRLIDIDVYTEDKAFRRITMRKCLVCNKPAHECIRNQSHSKKEIFKIIDHIIENALDKTISGLIDFAMTSELDLEPKFGLVTKSSSGSHKDMDYQLMSKAKKAIKPYLVKIFLTSFKSDSVDDIFDQARSIGLEAEEAMTKATNNINTYKGLIFSLGLLLAACGYELGRPSKIADIFNTVKSLVKDITLELNQNGDTFGKTAYREFGFTGARGEAEGGYANVQKAMMILVDFSEESLHKALVFLISNCEDTVFLKRSKSIQKYEMYKQIFSELTDFSKQNLNYLTSRCVKENLSFGGSADLLISSVFMKKYQQMFYCVPEPK